MGQNVNRITLVAALFASAACTSESKQESAEARAVGAAALTSADLGAGRVVELPWGSGAAALGFRPAVQERAAIGAPAFAVDGRGSVLVLDAVKGRVVRVHGTELAPLASVPKDADDIAVSSDGAFAVRRSVTPKVSVFDPAGHFIGDVDTGAVRDVDLIALGPSRRVMVTSPYQETFVAGSPSMPQERMAVLSTKREGAFARRDGQGLVVVRTDDGQIELRVVARSTEEDGRSRVTARHALGGASAARLVGVSGDIACARVEHVSEGAGGAVSVRREAVCANAVDGRVTLRVDLPSPGLYVPRRELVVGAGSLVMARPTERGLELRSWQVGGER